MNWGDLMNAPVQDEVHQQTLERLHGYMDTGHHAKARELLADYARVQPERAESMRLSLVRRYGTGL